jgi:G3E family GTPase
MSGAETAETAIPAQDGGPASARILIVTGFLGSGKTSLLNHLIRSLSEQGLPGSAFGVILNDFGPVVVDRDLILGANPELPSGEGHAILEIAGGSIFCSCLESAFLDGLRYYSRRRPQLLLVETSGLSDPTSIRRILGLDETVAGAFEIGAVLCVLDASQILDLLEVTEAARRQVQAGTLLVLNKTDLVDSPTLAQIKPVLTTLNPRAGIVETTQGRLDIRLLDRIPAPFLPPATASLNTPATRPASLLVDQRDLSLETLQGFLKAIEAHVLRLKGFYAVAGTTWFVEDDHGRILLRPYDRPVSSYGLSVLCAPAERGRIREAWRRAVSGKVEPWER